jgi:hypothetical protein
LAISGNCDQRPEHAKRPNRTLTHRRPESVPGNALKGKIPAKGIKHALVLTDND